MDLGSHIASLGLKTIGEYQRWCRDHGLSGALTKPWQERRRERALARQDTAAAASGREVEEHAVALGLSGVEEYRTWCVRHGLSDALHKGSRQRLKELDLARQERGDAALHAVRRLTRRPTETIEAIFSGDIGAGELKTEYLRRVAGVAADLSGSPPVRAALRHLLLHLEGCADLADLTPAVAQLGAAPGNTFLDGLAALARHCDLWLRDPADWRPGTHSRQRQFGSLARHLLARYGLPAFMDSAWFRGDTPQARQQQSWFVHLGTGGNLRAAEVPVALTRRMAHCFLQAPDDCTVEQALRWGQIVGQGGDEALVRAVNVTFLGESFQAEEFWGTVIHWLVRNPMLDPEWVGPVVDYIHHRKYEPQEVPLPGGGLGRGDPAEPNFSMKSRSAVKLLRQVEEWHARLARETRASTAEWHSCGIEGFELTEQGPGGAEVCWRVCELTTTRELNAEGRAMHHCVRSYVGSCRRGKTAVFSLQLSVVEPQAEGATSALTRRREGTRGDPEDGGRTSAERIMTVAVNPHTRQITQARGRFNALSSGRFHQHQKRRGLTDVYRACLRRSRAVLHQWAQARQLTWNNRI